MKDIENFIQDGLRKVQEESSAFDDKFASTSQRIEDFREQMSNKKWRLLKKNDSLDEKVENR